MGNYSVKILTDVNDVLSVLDQCANFKSPTNILAPSLNVYWLAAFIKYYGDCRSLAVTVVYENQIPKLIVPLHEIQDNTFDLLCDETSDYNDFLYEYASDEFVLKAFKYLLETGAKKIELRQLPHDSETIIFLRRIASELDLRIYIQPCDILPVVFPLTGIPVLTWPGVKQSLIKKYQKKLSKLRETGKVKFSILKTEDSFLDEFPRMMKLHIERWDSVGETSKFLDNRRVNFTIDICKEAIERGSLFNITMKINDALASYSIGFLGGETLFDWNASYSLHHRKISPGALLQLYMLANFEKLGFSKYNFLKGDEDYKYIWTNVEEKTLKITLVKE